MAALSPLALRAVRAWDYRLPVELQNFVLVKRRSPLWIRAGVVFVHVPKAAGTSINQALYGRFMGHIPGSSIRRWGSQEVRALPSFAVCRNPWDKLVSAYRFVKQGGGIGSPFTAGVWRPQLYRGPEFESFERFVIEWLDGREIGRLEYHFQPQTHYVCDDSGKIIVDHLGRYENLAPTIAFLEETVGHKLEVKRWNRSGDAVDYRSFYTPELIDIVGRIYADDVRILGYAFDG